MAVKKRRRAGSAKKRQAFVEQRYDIHTLHEEREYGLYWYAWLWKIVRPVLIFLCSALIVVGVVTMGYNKIYDTFLAPVDAENSEKVEFEIESGSSVSKIGAKLVESNLIRSDKVFKVMVQFEGLTNSLSYGTYQLSPDMTVSEVLAELTSGNQTNERTITIIPGWTCEDIADYLMSIGAITDREEFLTLCNDADRFVDTSYALRAAKDAGTLNGRRYVLEGYLAPDTYQIFRSASAESILNTLLAQENTVINSVFYTDHTEYYLDDDGNSHVVETYQTTLTMDETLILASIIEKEAGSVQDYSRVSAVFHNRITQGMKLESDATAAYITGTKKMILSSAELQQVDGYNTYTWSGLPVGAICNPSRAAIEAALYPDLDYINDNYLYFCATDPNSGELVFAKTVEEHEANVAKYRPLWEAFDLANSGN